MDDLKNYYLTTLGIDVGEIGVILEVRPFLGMVSAVDGAITKVFSDESWFVPAQAVPTATPRPDPRCVFCLGYNGLVFVYILAFSFDCKLCHK